METMFTLILTLIVLFSFGVSGYFALFKFPMKDPKAKVLAFLLMGAVATAFTFVVCLTLIWPPVTM